jgi:hypothetical protein
MRAKTAPNVVVISSFLIQFLAEVWIKIWQNHAKYHIEWTKITHVLKYKLANVYFSYNYNNYTAHMHHFEENSQM